MWAAVFLKDGADNSKRPEGHRTEPGTDRTGQEVRKESREESVKQRLHGWSLGSMCRKANYLLHSPQREIKCK